MKRKALSILLMLMLSLIMIIGTSSSALAGVTVYLNTLKPVAPDYDQYEAGSAKINGTAYSSSLYRTLYASDEGLQEIWAEYNLEREYTSFQGVVGISDDAPESATEAQFRIYGDDALLYESPAKKLGDEPSAFNVSVKNVLRLKIVTTRIDGGYYALRHAVWANPYLTGPKIVEMTIGQSSYRINDSEQIMDVAPYIKASRTRLPVRFVAEALGANVSWNGNTKEVTIVGEDNTTLVLTIGSNVMQNNGANTQMDVGPEITSSRTMLPIRWVAEALGATVDWNEAAQLVTITLP